MDLFKRLARGTGVLIIAAVIQAPVGLLATWSLNEVIKNDGTRDAFIGAVWIIVLLVGAGVALIGVWRLSASPASTASSIVPEGIPPDSEINADIVRVEGTLSNPSVLAPIPAPASGETLVGDALTADIRGGDPIDYYPGARNSIPRLSRYEQIGNIRRLKLGEIALLRRLRVSTEGGQNPRRCETLLRAAGISQSELSISRLENMRLIDVRGDWVILTDLGEEFVWLFTQCLVHDAALVTAYREVTPEIDRAIRFDGEPIRL